MKKSNPNTSKESSATRLAEWSSTLSFDDIPNDAQHIARRCIIDCFAVGIGGATQEIAKKSRELAFSEYRDGNSTIFGSTYRLATTGAAMANGTAAHALDFDDTCYAGITHGTAIIGPAVYAIAEEIDCDGSTLLTAFIAGSEIAYTLGKATGNSVYFKGWWGTTIYGTIGAAAGAARVLSLNVNEMCSDGVFDRGVLDLIGQVFGLIEPGIFIKPYPSCTASHAALEATDQTMTSNNLTANDVERIICHVPKLVDISLIYDNPKTTQQGQFSMQFTLACMLAKRKFSISELTQETLDEAVIRDEMAKITVLRDADLTKRATEGQVGPECAQIEIITKDGRYLKTFNSVAIGAPTKPMSDDALDAKFHSLAGHAGLGNKADTLLERLHNIENIESVRRLF